MVVCEKKVVIESFTFLVCTVTDNPKNPVISESGELPYDQL